jgi:hypothetical protein
MIKAVSIVPMPLYPLNVYPGYFLKSIETEPVIFISGVGVCLDIVKNPLFILNRI